MTGCGATFDTSDLGRMLLWTVQRAGCDDRANVLACFAALSSALDRLPAKEARALRNEIVGFLTREIGK